MTDRLGEIKQRKAERQQGSAVYRYEPTLAGEDVDYLLRRLEAAEAVAQNVIDFKGEWLEVVKRHWAEAIEEELVAWEKAKEGTP